MSELSDAIAKARGDAGDNIPAGIRFLNEMSRRLTGVHTHECGNCPAKFDCIEHFYQSSLKSRIEQSFAKLP